MDTAKDLDSINIRKKSNCHEKMGHTGVATARKKLKTASANKPVWS